MKKEKETRNIMVIKKKLNNKGVALISAYVIISVLITLSAGFALTTTNELRYASRYQNSTQAFWLAEAGINRFIADTTILDTTGSQTITLGNGSIYLVKDDSDSTVRIVTATATVNGVQREIQIEFPPNNPPIYHNTASSGGNIHLNGVIATLNVFGKTRITGTFTKSGFLANAWFEDKEEGVPEEETTLKYPDADINGASDEFNDFIQFNQNVLSTYSCGEIVHIQSDDSQIIVPNSGLADKKIIFVEGSAPGTGDVYIFFDASWQSDQNLTIISTGSVSYLQPLQFASNSKLNIIAWENYEEPSILISTHDGVTFTHSVANFYSIFNYSSTTGNLIANEGIVANEVISWKEFYYSDPLVDDNFPPGFEGLLSAGATGYSSTPNEWKEN